MVYNNYLTEFDHTMSWLSSVLKGVYFKFCDKWKKKNNNDVFIQIFGYVTVFEINRVQVIIWQMNYIYNLLAIVNFPFMQTQIQVGNKIFNICKSGK